MSSLKDRVREANRKYHNQVNTSEYENNKSIFGARRQSRIRNHLDVMATAGSRHLDVGCGTGNVLKMADDYFSDNYGIDISKNMLESAQETVADRTQLTLGTGDRLPFPDNTFDAVTFYAILHHFPSPVDFLKEGARVLKDGGYLYTDHDPNYFLMRFYFPIYKILHWNRSGFGSKTGDLAEYFHTQQPGIDPRSLRDVLEHEQFGEINVEYYQTTNDELGWAKDTVMNVLKPLSEIVSLKSFFTHFSIMARN